jgi:hypothetical protein
VRPAASGDFNGDGKADYAVILPSRAGQTPPLFLVAFATDSEWRVQQLSIDQSLIRVDGYVLRTIPPGTYKETPAILPTGVTGRTLTSKTDGILMGRCESWVNGHFYIGRHWFTLALSD